ncbi:MAG: transcriptional repressor [Pseudomonadota bacterium]
MNEPQAAFVTDDAGDSLFSKLSSYGLRPTWSRQKVCEVLDAATDHPDVYDIDAAVNAGTRRVSLSSVYRILAELEQHNLIRRFDIGDDRARFEKISGKKPIHVINRANGEIIACDSSTIEACLRQVADDAGFELVDFDLNLFARPTQ